MSLLLILNQQLGGAGTAGVDQQADRSAKLRRYAAAELSYSGLSRAERRLRINDAMMMKRLRGALNRWAD